MSLGTHNNTKSGEANNFKSGAGFYVSNTSDIDTIALKQKLGHIKKGRRARSRPRSKQTKYNKDLQ